MASARIARLYSSPISAGAGGGGVVGIMAVVAAPAASRFAGGACAGGAGAAAACDGTGFSAAAALARARGAGSTGRPLVLAETCPRALLSFGAPGPDGEVFAGSVSSATSAGGRSAGPNRALLALQSMTSCGSTFGNGLRALGGCALACMIGIMQ